MSSTFPIRRVVLYKHGVGYFERQAIVNGDESLTLDVKTDDMNDILKSLSPVDLDGGHIASMSYPSPKPVAKQLEELSISLDGTSGLHTHTALLAKGIGAPVRLMLSDDTKVTGTIVGVEDIVVRNEEEKRTETSYRLNILEDGDTLTWHSLDSIESFEFLDTALRSDLQLLMDLLLSEKKRNVKKLTIEARGEGRRTLVASAVVATAVWKTSYRLVLADGVAKLHAFALIDNTTDEHWKEVDVQLVGGVYNAFQHNLYEPRFKKRPVLQVHQGVDLSRPLPSLRSLVPNLDKSLLVDCPTMLSQYSTEGASMVQREATKDKKLPDPFVHVDRYVPPEADREHLQGKIKTRRKLDEVDCFAYKIEKPVTVRRGESALVPFMTVDGYKGGIALLFNRSLNATNPLSVVQFVNPCDYSLDGGPLTIYEEHSCLGETLLESISVGDTRFLPFGTERNVTVKFDQKFKQHANHYLELEEGNITVKYYDVCVTTYKVKNRAPRDRTLYIEHKFQSSKAQHSSNAYELAPGSPEIASKTKNYWRFPVELKSGAEVAELKIAERRESSRTLSIESVVSNMSLEVRQREALGKYLPKKVCDEAIKVLVLKEKWQKDTKKAKEEQDRATRDKRSQDAEVSAISGKLRNAWHPDLESKSFARQLESLLKAEEALTKVTEQCAKAIEEQFASERAYREALSALKYTGELEQGKWNFNSL